VKGNTTAAYLRL